MSLRPLQILLVLCAIAMSGCHPAARMQLPENAFVEKTEAAVLSQLGKPDHEFPGHYGNPSLDFTRRFSGEIKTLVFKKSGGEYYVSFEKRPAGWVGISSSWLPDGAAF